MTDETTAAADIASETTTSETVAEQETELQSTTEQLGEDETAAVEDQEQPVEEDSGDVEETVEIEYGGKKYRVPKEIKDGVLMQADYTRKTQELAEHRRSLESEREAFRKSQEIARQHIAEVGQLHVIRQALEQYQKLDWATLQATDPEQAQRAQFEYIRLKDQHDQLATKVEQAVREASDAEVREFQRRYQETTAILNREIKGWSEAAPKVRDFLMRSGTTQDELRVIATSPHLSKLAHLAWVGKQLMEKQQAAAKKATEEVRKPDPAAEAKPLKTVGKKPSGAHKPGVHDDLPIDEWMRRENERLLRRQRAH